MPFAGFEDWDACMRKMRQKYDEETAKKVCGKLKHEHEDAMARGLYDRCKKLAKRLGLDEKDSHVLCAEFLNLKDADETKWITTKEGRRVPVGPSEKPSGGLSKQSIEIIAQEHTDPKIRAGAIQSLENEKLLENLVLSEENPLLKAMAWWRLKDIAPEGEAIKNLTKHFAEQKIINERKERAQREHEIGVGAPSSPLHSTLEELEKEEKKHLEPWYIGLPDSPEKRKEHEKAKKIVQEMQQTERLGKEETMRIKKIERLREKAKRIKKDTEINEILDLMIVDVIKKKEEEKEEEEKEEKKEPEKGKWGNPKWGKPKTMQLPLFQPIRAPKSQHRLQIKMETPRTAEQKLLTMEQLEKRTEYAKSIKKRDAIWVIDGLQFDSYNNLTNVIKVPVILAREMVQEYKNPETKEKEYHFKPYDELKKPVDIVDDLPIIIEHKEWKKDDIVGYIKELKGDDNDRSLKGFAYLTESKLPKYVVEAIRSKMTIPVSIGFWADVQKEDGEYSGKKYGFVQRDFTLDHLAICLSSIPRCPPNQCGINLDSVPTDEMDGLEFIINDNEYYNIEIYGDLEETETKNIYNKENGDSFLDKKPIIAKAHIAEGHDLTKLLSKLREFCGILPPDKRADAEDIILSIMEDLVGENQKMDDNEKFQEEIANLKDQINQLNDAISLKNTEIEAKQKLLDSFEEKERLALVEKIKKSPIKYEDAELEGKCVKELQVISDALSHLNFGSQKPRIIPKGEHKMEDSTEYKRVDPAKIADSMYGMPDYKMIPILKKQKGE